MAHGEVYAAEFGWDTRFEALVAQIVVDYTASDRPQSQGAWIVLGSRLVATAVGFARAAGYERMRLWTNHPLVAARRIYLEQGFCLVAEEPHHSFGVDLIGQTYELALTETD
jgi:GNAT superfamily N-acetyltransferase